MLEVKAFCPPPLVCPLTASPSPSLSVVVVAVTAAFSPFAVAPPFRAVYFSPAAPAVLVAAFIEQLPVLKGTACWYFSPVWLVKSNLLFINTQPSTIFLDRSYLLMRCFSVAKWYSTSGQMTVSI